MKYCANPKYMSYATPRGKGRNLAPALPVAICGFGSRQSVRVRAMNCASISKLLDRYTRPR